MGPEKVLKTGKGDFLRIWGREKRIK